jgi:DNA repair protein RecO (recombination protein O)
MPDPREYQTEAIVIKKTKLGEADSILTFFTPRLGKIQGFAKSLRKPKSKMAGHLELLTYSTVSLARGRGNIDTITGAQTINAFMPVKNDLWLTSCGLYVAELVHQFTAEHQENYLLFRLMVETLERLCGEANNKESVLRYFELNLLESAGYRPQLRECVTCHKPLEPVVNYFSPLAGGLLCPVCHQAQFFTYSLSLNAQKVLRLFQNAEFAEVARVKIDEDLGREIENVISGYLKYLLEKEVRSAAWLDELRQQRFLFEKRVK